MNTHLTNYTDISKYIKELNSNSLSCFSDNEIFISSLQKFSKSTLSRLALKLLMDYESFYIDKLSNYIKKEYNIGIISEDTINQLQSDTFIQLVTDFQTTFNYLKKYIRINSCEDLNRIKTIIHINVEPLDTNDISSDELSNLFSEIPYTLTSTLERNGFINNITDVKITFYEDDQEYGVFITQMKNKYYSNKETKIIKLLDMV